MDAGEADQPEVEVNPRAIAQVRRDEKLFGSLGCDTTYDEDGQFIFLNRAPKTELQIIKDARDLTRKSKESNVMGEAFREKGYIGGRHRDRFITGRKDFTY